MTRIAVLGNSHVAAVKLAWPGMQKNFPGVELTFFAQPQRALEGLHVADGALVPQNEDLKQAIMHTSGGQDRVDPRIYDAVLLYGLALRPYRRPLGFFSQAVLSRAVQDHVGRSVSFILLNRLRQISDLPIFVAPEPLRAFKGVQEMWAEGLYPISMQMIEAVLQPFNVTVLRQPQETICGGFFTRHELSIGSQRLVFREDQKGQAHPEGEDEHMNAEYGSIFLATHLPAIASVRQAA